MKRIDKRVTSNLRKWQGRLQDQYGSFDEWEGYSDIYGLAERLGFANAQEAWDANPVIAGGVNPEDYRVVHKVDVLSMVSVGSLHPVEKRGRIVHKATVRVFDNGGTTADRYTVLIDDEIWTMSEDALSPAGVNQYGGDSISLGYPSFEEFVRAMESTGKELTLDALPTQVRQAIDAITGGGQKRARRIDEIVHKNLSKAGALIDVYQTQRRGDGALQITGAPEAFEGTVDEYVGSFREHGADARLMSGGDEPTIYNYPAGGKTVEITDADGQVDYVVVTEEGGGKQAEKASGEPDGLAVLEAEGLIEKDADGKIVKEKFGSFEACVRSMAARPDVGDAKALCGWIYRNVAGGGTKQARRIDKAVHANLQKATPNWEEPGCYIDESAGSADDCNRRIIEFAQGYGFSPGEMPDEANEDYGQILSETADEAVDFLNSNNQTPNSYWEIEDNSLYLRAEDEDAPL